MAKNLGRKAIDLALEALANGTPVGLGMKMAQGITGTDNPVDAYKQELKDVGSGISSAAKWANENLNPFSDGPADPEKGPAPVTRMPEMDVPVRVQRLDIEPGETITARPRGGGVAPKRKSGEELGPVNGPAEEPRASAPVQMAAPSSPREDKPLEDQEMIDAQEDARKRRLWGMLPAFLSNFASSGEELRKTLREEEGRPIADLLARRGELRKKAEDRDKEEERTRRLDLDDVNSPLSKQAQMVYIRRGVDPQLASQLPASAMQSILSAESANDAAKNQIALREQAKLDLASREKEGAANRANQYAIAKMNNEGDLEKARLAATNKGASEQLQTYQEVKDRAANIRRVLNDLRARIKDKGTYELFGPHNANMEQELNSIAADYAKIVDPKSVNRESEIAMARKSLFEPGPWQQDATALGSLDNFEKLVADREKNFNWARGFPGGSAPAAPQGITRTVDGVTKRWDGSKWVE